MIWSDKEIFGDLNDLFLNYIYICEHNTIFDVIRIIIIIIIIVIVIVIIIIIIKR